MSLAKKEVEEKTIEASQEKKVTLKVIDGNKEEKAKSADYLNEKLEYFYSHGGPIMDI
jgi:hypothetical protein